jgi:glycosyltransferase involved in cell wall biosynthesis
MAEINKKPKISFLIPYPLDSAPGQRFRFEQYLEYLSQFYQIDIFPFINKKTYDILYKRRNIFQKVYGIIAGIIYRFRSLFLSLNSDAIFIFRESSFIGPPIIEYILSKIFRKKIIFDFDDAIWLQNISENNRVWGWLKFHNKTKTILKLSTTVIAGNSYLATYAAKYNNNVTIIPTTINTSYHKKFYKYCNNCIIIGWTGTITTNKHLALLNDCLSKIKNTYGNKIEIRMISNAPFESQSSFINYIPWNKQSEIEDLSQFDIGIMPLPDDQWARGKCGFKGLQYMALEIPTIMSPVGVNIDIIENGINGYLASTNEEWFQKICYLIENPSERTRVGQAGRQTIINKYSVESQKNSYKKVFHDTLLEKF